MIFCGMCCSLFGSFSKTNVKKFEFDVFAWILCLGPYNIVLFSPLGSWGNFVVNMTLTLSQPWAMGRYMQYDFLISKHGSCVMVA